MLSDDDVLAFTRGIRVQVVNSLMTGGAVSGENSDRILLTNMLSGLDSQALNSKKLLNDQKSADNAAVIVAELLRNIDKNRAFQIAPGGMPDGHIIDVEARVVPPTIPDMPAVPGEMDVNPGQLDYASFVRAQGKDVDQIGKNVKHQEAEDTGDDIP
jgi:hypothetical protein